MVLMVGILSSFLVRSRPGDMHKRKCKTFKLLISMRYIPSSEFCHDLSSQLHFHESCTCSAILTFQVSHPRSTPSKDYMNIL
jgi:hypothetical protein